MVIQFFLSCLYFFLPAYLANMTPPLVWKFNFLAVPVDFGRSFQGKRILGSHKTWRGVVCGLLVGILATYSQLWLYQFPFIQEISLFDYSQINILLFGSLLSGGAIFGDLLFSFFKRRINFPPGQRWLPFDQTDYVIGAYLFLIPFLVLDIKVWLTLFMATFFLHIAFNRLGYWLGLHNSKW